jgi:hypothetical protein
MGMKRPRPWGVGGGEVRPEPFAFGAKTNTGRDFLCELPHTAWGNYDNLFGHGDFPAMASAAMGWPGRKTHRLFAERFHGRRSSVPQQ